MVPKQNIELQKEYSVSKITGRWGIRRRIRKLGINSETKLSFTKKSKLAYYKFHFTNCKRKRRLPANYLKFIKFVESDNPQLQAILFEDHSNISIDVFSNEETLDTNIFENKTEYKFNEYNFSINYLPKVSSIYGEDYQRKKLRNKVLTDFPDVFLGIVDFENLEADLNLVTQFIDMDAKIVLALRNYNPEGGSYYADFELLSKLLGVPIINYSEIEEGNSVREKILETLIKTHQNTEPYVRHIHINYGRQVEQSISKLKKFLKRRSKADYVASPRYLAIGLLEKDSLVHKLFDGLPCHKRVKRKADKQIKRLEKLYDDHIFNIIKKSRKAYVNGAITEITAGKKPETKSKKIDKILTHKYFGIPIFIAFMGLTFFATFELGKYPMEWLENGVDYLAKYLSKVMAPGFFKDLVLDGAIDGVGGVLVFLPNIFILFFFIGILENTGYMSRAAFLMDKYMHRIGLHGKSFIPMIMGFGCTVPAIMSTRILENKRDRILTMMILPFMSCSAKLPVYILMISAFFPENPVLILFGIYMFGIILALIISSFFSKTILKQREAPFVMELLPYRKPTTKLLLTYTWDRGKEYLKKIGGVILIGSIIIWLLGYFPKNIDYSKDYQALISAETKLEEPNIEKIHELEFQKRSEEHEKSYIGKIGHFIKPVMKPLGFDWKMSVSILAGIAGKEITVSTMGVLYQADDDLETGSLQNKLKAETYAFGEKAGEKVYNPAVALAFILFILIYFPCIATISAIWKESKLKWAIFSGIYTTSIAWLVSFAAYQIAKHFI
ncbi:MAG: ferrous iron transport protein B [Bacteroidales bacterium]|jgi:ferrous iron transport protein B|nr:ferrous iron transport protein B [Bacteroidales bacterium]MDY0315128.1 ferrous iron transport protein B [Bacteroidales bacterium]NLB86746.1 ferrous iron transport protein B [Bacteroidales bacterium]